MEMREKMKAVPSPVVFATRQASTVSCPYCWTTQQAERDCCWRCGATFVYLDEADAPPESEAAGCA